MAIVKRLVQFARKPLHEKIAAIEKRTGPIISGRRANIHEWISPQVYAPSSRPALRLALVGCGDFAINVHLPAWRKLEKTGLVDLVALCSRSQDSLTRANDAYGGKSLKQYTSLDALLADPEIDVVDLTLPITTMPDAIRASLRAGKHVISEKPCAPDVAQCIDLLTDYINLEHRPVWAVSENWRFKSLTILAEQLVKSGRIGKIETVNFSLIQHIGTENLRWRGAPDYQGGHIFDWGVHFVALVRRIAGEIDHVSAIVSQRRPHLPPADGVTSVISFANGAEGSFQLSFAAPETAPPVAMLSVIGSEGFLDVDFHRNRVRLRNAKGEKEKVIVLPEDSFNGGVERLFAHCLGAMRHGSPLRSSASDAMRDVAVIEGMIASSRSGKSVSLATLYPALHGGGAEVATFGGVFKFTPKHIVDCGSVADVSAAVRHAVSAGLRIRPMGMGYSWAPQLMTRDVSLRVSQLDRILNIDKTKNTVTAEAGVRVGELTRALAEHDLALPSLPWITETTIGGAIASGTHGTSPKWGTMSDSVRSMKVVLATGDVKHFGPDSTDDELRAARLAIGMLDVIIELELDVVPMPYVRFVTLNLSLQKFLEELPTINARYEHIWAHWLLGADTVRVDCFESSPKPADGYRRYVVGESAGWVPQKGKPERRPGQIDVNTQYSVPLLEIRAAVERLRGSQFAAANHGQVVEMKFLKGENRTFLGPNAGGNSVSFNLAWSVDEETKNNFFAPFEALMRDLNGQPHWGKFHQLPDLDYMKKAFPHWDKFDAVRARLDPAGTFSFFPAHHV